MASTRKILLLCQDRIGHRMAGPAIRYAQFARELAERGWTVTVLVAQPVDDDYSIPGVRFVERDVISWRLVRGLAADHDVVLTQPQRVHLAQALHAAGTPVVYDLYAPLLVEQLGSQAAETDIDLTRRRRIVAKFALEEQAALETGAAFLCASEEQRTFWLGALSARGRLTLDGWTADADYAGLVSVAPFGMPDEPPAAGDSPAIRGVMPGIAQDDVVLLWAGGIWNWLDPLTIIEAMARATPDEPRLKLVFMGGQHPNDDVRFAMTGQARELARARDLFGSSVFFNEGWVPYEARGSWLADADLGVSAHFSSLETRLSFRQRLIDHVWAGLPTLATRGDTLGDQLAAAGAGVTLDDGAVGAWADSMLQLARNPERRATLRTATEALQDHFRWSTICDGLAATLAHVIAEPGATPRRSPARHLPRYVGLQARLQGPGPAVAKIARSLRRT